MSDGSAKVIEIGSGDGRDAIEIIERVSSYIGVEPSKGLLEIARKDFPSVHFVEATAQDYDFPDDIDVVYAFASVLHLGAHDLAQLFSRISHSLKSGGIFYISTKESDPYRPELKEDVWGLRQFYLYSEQELMDMAGTQFTKVYVSRQLKEGTGGETTHWITIAFKKQ